MQIVLNVQLLEVVNIINTLQDVAILWGLPIQGEPVAGVTDMNWTGPLQNIFGPGVGDDAFKQKKVTKKDGSTYYRPSKYHLR